MMTAVCTNRSIGESDRAAFFSSGLFNSYSEIIIRNIKHHEGVRVGGENINNLRYADDTVLIADSEEKLQNILTTVTVESENKGLQLNAKKTECMVISKQSDIPVCNTLRKGERIKQVDTFKYLGFTITPGVRCDTEIKKRMALSKDTFTEMKSIFNSRNMKVYTKTNTVKAYIWSILLCGFECWTLTKDLERKLKTAEMWYIRRIMRISWTEKKSNKEVMEMAGYKIPTLLLLLLSSSAFPRSLLKTIRKRQLQFFGHRNRADGLEKQILSGKRKTTHKIHRRAE